MRQHDQGERTPDDHAAEASQSQGSETASRPALTAADLRPWEPGNTMAQRHGAYSSRVIEPVAAEVMAEVLADESTSYLRASSYTATLTTWATVQARAEVFGAYLASLSIEDQLRPPRGGAKSPLDTWLGMVKTAATLADKLGLTPLSRARLGRDVSTAAAMQSATLDALREQGRAALAARPGRPSATESAEHGRRGTEAGDNV